MEDDQNYTSLQNFTEEIYPSANKRFFQDRQGAQGLKRGVECIRGQATWFVLFGLLCSICANIVLSVLIYTQPSVTADSETVSLGLRLDSVQQRYARLCEDYTTLGQSCSKMVKKCRECPEDWHHVGDQCYHFSSDKLIWEKSRGSCVAMGSHLAVLHTKAQHEALEQEVRRIGSFDYHFWIGLSDLEKEGEWRWVDNTTLVTEYWNKWNLEPNNHQSGGLHGEDCAVLDTHSQSWYDVPCEHIYKYVCQMVALKID